MLGLTHKGISASGPTPTSRSTRPTRTPRRCSHLPRYVIKAGRVLVEQGEIREESFGKTLHVAPEYDREVEADIREWFEGRLLDPLAELSGRGRKHPANPR